MASALQNSRLVPRPRPPSALTTPLEVVKQISSEHRLGNYSVIAPLGRGGTAGVYLAEHLVTKERVALKVLDPYYCEHAEVVERLFAERAVSERVRHIGLLDIQMSDRSTDGVPYLVMEYLDGENLGVLAERGRIALDAVVAIGAQIAEALGALHTAGIVHCDVKPDNVFVLYQTGPGGWPRVKMIDYGVARMIDAGPLPGSTIAGTPSYMSPEQWRGEPSVKSDVYSLGILLYELVTGDQPFNGTLSQLMTAHCERLPERPGVRNSELSAEFERLIMRALSKDPALRPTMGEMELGLSRLLQSWNAPSTNVLAAVG